MNQDTGIPGMCLAMMGTTWYPSMPWGITWPRAAGLPQDLPQSSHRLNYSNTYVSLYYIKSTSGTLNTEINILYIYEQKVIVTIKKHFLCQVLDWVNSKFPWCTLEAMRSKCAEENCWPRPLFLSASNDFRIGMLVFDCKVFLWRKRI